MKCPHCNDGIHASFHESKIYNGDGGWSAIGEQFWSVYSMECPACKKAIISLSATNARGTLTMPSYSIYPRSSNRPAPPKEVPADIAADYVDASNVLSVSPKASAALSRRCVQAVLRDRGYPQHDLAPAIQAALDSGTLPTAIEDNLDAVRQIGNYAAHPMKDKHTGEILPVEPHEAEWNLDVLDELFDFYYVQPQRAESKRLALNEKLKAAGKPEMKKATHQEKG